MRLEFYKSNRRYTETLRDSDPREFQSLPWLCRSHSFYEKYANALGAGMSPHDPVLDVGCGVGQTVRLLTERGLQAHGVDVSETSIAFARQHAGRFQIYDGHTLPFDDRSIAAVGAFNVLEHVEEQIALLDEMTRTLRPGGRMVISSPNFLRVFGWRDYHPHMRGILQKWRNLETLRRHARLYAEQKDAVLFEKLVPIERETYFPDDDAVTATNALDFRQYLQVRGYRNIRVSCVDRPTPKWMETLLDATPLRFLMLNAFVTAEKS